MKHAAHLQKPQLSFKRKPNNSSGLRWYPSIRHKYNAQVPLGYVFRDEDMERDAERSQCVAFFWEMLELLPKHEMSSYRDVHPYRYEITHLQYPSWMFDATPAIPPKSFDETPFTWVATPNEFAAMLDELRSAKEIAVDLEHHSYRSFAGFLCLMQISTREQDWIVDALVLREELTELNEIFTNPNIVKVRSDTSCPIDSSSLSCAHRCFTAPRATSFGSNKTSVSLSSVCSILFTHPKSSVSISPLL